MFNRKNVIIVLMLFVAIISISSVSACEIDSVDNISMADSDNNADVIQTADGQNDVLEEDSYDYLGEEGSDDSVSENSFNSTITLSQSGSYVGDKVITAKLTDLDGNPLAGEEIVLSIYSINYETDSNFDFIHIKTNSNGIATYKWNVDSFACGTYNIEADTVNNCSDTAKLDNVKVVKKAIKIKPTALTTTYNSGKAFTIKVVGSNNEVLSGVKLKVKVKGKTYYAKTNNKGIATITFKSLTKGTYKVVVSPTAGYSGSSVKSKIVIKPKALKITAKSYKVNTRDIAGGVIDIQVKDKSTNKGLNNIKLTLKIYTGKKYKTVKLVTGYDSDNKKKGVAGLISNEFSVGTHKVVITSTSGNYKGSATAKLTITKNAKKNYYSFHIYFTKGKLVMS